MAKSVLNIYIRTQKGVRLPFFLCIPMGRHHWKAIKPFWVAIFSFFLENVDNEVCAWGKQFIWNRCKRAAIKIAI